MIALRTRRWRSLLRIAQLSAAALLAIGASGALAVVPGQHAGAPVRAMADDPPQEPWYNGCSSPFGDSPGGYTFTDACNWHDLCYGGHNWDNQDPEGG